MPIDVHAHYLPRRTLDALAKEGSRYGVSLIDQEPGCQCLRFDHGLRCRPFFTKLIEEPARRIDSMRSSGIDRQVLSGWTDVFGYGLNAAKGVAWHRLMNESLAALCHGEPANFSMLASGHLPDAAAAARELHYAVKELGALGGIASCNVEGTNLGELALDEYWAAAVELGVPVFLHPAQPLPAARTKAFALNQVAQYTFDTTLAVGSLIWSGVLDRFPTLTLILSHGGGTFPALAGRFDCMHARSNHATTGIASAQAPSTYLMRMYYDSILHDPLALRQLAGKVGVDRIVIGSDDSFPPADRDPLGTLNAAGFNSAQIQRIAELNPRELFRLAT